MYLIYVYIPSAYYDYYNMYICRIKNLAHVLNVYIYTGQDVVIFEKMSFYGMHRNFIGMIEETAVRENGREVKTKDHWFPRVVPNAAYRGTAVHYFLMSNKAISMCPDQGPQVLTRVISPGSPACATSSSERRTLLSVLLSPPLSIPSPPCAGRWRDHVTTLHPQRRGMLDAAKERERGSTRRRWRP